MNLIGRPLLTEDEILRIRVGDSFVSVVFHYLDSPIKASNPTVSGHLDKMAQLGINLNSYESSKLSEDWRKKREEVREKMINSDSAHSNSASFGYTEIHCFPWQKYTF